VVLTYRLPRTEVRALSGVSAEFPRGAITAVVGPSGSGKSSLLRLLAGIDRPSSGVVEVEGRTVSSAGAAARRRLRRGTVGFVFQRPSDNLLAFLTVADHLRLAGRRPSDVLERLGLRSRAGHVPAQLSGGEQQRAAIARALAGGAGVLLADEPTAELDDEAAGMVIGALRDVAAAGTTVIAATHDRALQRAADHVVVLDHGRIREGRGRHPGDEVIPLPPGAVTGGSVLVEATGLEKSYRGGEVHAVREVSLRLVAGEVVALVGRSGSGKSTLLNLIGGWEAPDRGHIHHAAAPGGGLPGWEAVAFVPQHLGLIDELTLRENIELPRRAAGVTDGGERVDELVDLLGLEALQHRFPREASLGEQQRVGVARALSIPAALVVADEPTAHQDATSARAVLEALSGAADEGGCCLIATHDDLVGRYAGRTLTMHDGRLEPPG
jgi:ABC-type lipoprotein export system ATPase subunit